MAAVCGFSQCLARHLLQRGEDGVTQEATGRRGSGRDGAEGGRQAGEAVQGQVVADAGADTRLPGTLRTLRSERRRRHQRPRTAQGLQADGISTRQLADRGIIDLLTNSAAAAAAAALFGKIQCFAHCLGVPLLGSYLPKRATSYQGRSQDFCLPKVKVKVHTLDIAPLRSESPLQKRSGMARVLKGFHSFTCTPTRSCPIRMSHTCFCLPSRSWYSFTDPGGMEG